MRRELDIIALSPPGFDEPWVGSAAHRAGCCGGLSLEYAGGDKVLAVLANLPDVGRGWTVALPRPVASWLDKVRPFARRLNRILLCGVDDATLSDEISAIKTSGIDVLVEVTSVASAVAAQQAGADGIVVKGNEAGGLIGEETSFILLQRVTGRVHLPIWVRGGVGLHSAAACLAGGASGVVLDWQLALCEEMRLPAEVEAKIRRMDGSETAVLGQDCAARYRVFAQHGDAAHAAMREYEAEHSLDATASADVLHAWRNEIEKRAQEPELSKRLLMVGQDAAFAPYLAERFGTVAEVCRAIRREATRQCALSADEHPIREQGPLAASHGTRYPIVQGPMTRVSDTADFALAVAEGGGLPFLALALLRGPQVARLLEETKHKLGDRPWGVGILGFVPKELREEQLAEIRKHPPPFAIIAGGRPDQAAHLEKEGIQTYLHVPSPGLLKMFLESGARRVIFEGRECGGHVGPRSSFVLWDSMVRAIGDHLAGSRGPASDYHVLFAGGVHDSKSAAMVAALAAPLVERGVRIGVLVGTAYLFTKEAVTSGAIVSGFQEEALRCAQTVLLETGVGHATRCADTPFAIAFREEKLRLQREGKSAEEIRDALEQLNLGRLRIASKAIMRATEENGDGPQYANVENEAQHREGMYMIGQVAALRERIETIADLHAEIVRQPEEVKATVPAAPARRVDGPCDVAIVGMSCTLPGAGDVKRYWENILDGVNAIREIPEDLWDADLYFDRDRRARDKVYSRWGGFIDPVAFDPTRYGMPPSAVPSVEPVQLLVLESVRQALEDAGLMQRPFPRERTCVIYGAGGGVGNVGLGYGFRSMLPHYLAQLNGAGPDAKQLIEQLGEHLPEWTEDSFAGLLLNVISGRVANRFDLGGTNCTVDAACASSLAAVRLAVCELISGAADVAIAGGADTMQSPFAYLCFSKTQALSPTGQARTFDAEGDGIVIAEGIATIILKRLEDARRDGDRVYAVIKGVGSSSDGKDKGLTAPRPEGQMRALWRAYGQAGFGPESVELIEAHGTGTIVGDKSELESVTRVLLEAGAELGTCAIGSVKSMIGHTKCTAGVAGLIKAALAVHHGVLPPTGGVTKPNPKANLERSPLYVNTETRPWVRRAGGEARRAGVSAFGFGGTNFHAVMEEVCEAGHAVGRITFPAELLVFRGRARDDIVAALDRVAAALEAGSSPSMAELAAAVWRDFGRAAGGCCLAIVAGSLKELREKTAIARKAAEANTGVYRDPRGVFYTSKANTPIGRIAFVFPGQGSQRVNMLRDLAVALPRVREVFEEADRMLADVLGGPLSRYVNPKPAFCDEERAANEDRLTHTRIAQPALGATSMALLRLLGDLGISTELSCGHSYGEFTALCAAGAISFEDLMQLSELRGRLMAEAASASSGAMAALEADESTAKSLLEGVADVYLANLNSPSQTVISGAPGGVEELMRRCQQRGINTKAIRVSCAFHSPHVAGAAGPFAAALDRVNWSSPRYAVFSNTTGGHHETDPRRIREVLADHLVRPVRFVEEVRAMYDAGARVFIEVGPGRVLSNLIEKTLAGRDIATIPLDQANRGGLVQIMYSLAELAVCGVRFDLTPLLEGRVERRMGLDKLLEESRPKPPSPTTWMVRGDRAEPVGGAKRKNAVKGRARISEREEREAVSLSKGNSSGQAGGHGPPGSESIGTSGRQQASPSAQAGSAQRNGVPVDWARPREALPARSSHEHRAVSAGGVDAVMAAHNQFMSRFIEAHRNIMLAYLQGGAAGESARPAPYALPESIDPEPSVSQPQREPRGSTPSDAPIAVPMHHETELPMVRKAHVEESPAAIEKPSGNGEIVKSDGGFSRERLIAQLTEVVADRTGYPPDMLTLDLDLEADLGIDSIKRIEILGTLQNSSVLPGESSGGDMESLARLSTLRAIVDFVEQHAGGNGSVQSAAPAIAEGGASTRPFDDAATGRAGPPRMLVKMVEADGGNTAVDPSAGSVVILGSDRGTGEEVRSRLVAAGREAEYLTLDDVDEKAAVERIEAIRRRLGRVGTLVILAGDIGSRKSGTAADAAFTIEEPLTTVFLIVKTLEGDLRDGGTILAATRMGGTLGFQGVEGDRSTALTGAAIGGLVKSLAREWGGTRCRVVDFKPDASAQVIADALIREWQTDDDRLEVGYDGQRRLAPQIVTAPLHGETETLTLDAESVVLVTGGARGITAACARELARRFPCRYVLVGRTPLPSEGESAATADRTDMKALKAAIRDEISSRGEKATPAAVESVYRRLLAEREMRETVADLRGSGANVEYAAMNAGDADAFGGLIDRLYAEHGRIDGVIHGAGVIEDKLIGDKTAASFRRVVRTKIAPAMVLAEKLRGESLRFLAMFSSVSARYGNRGQGDYAAANEVLNKLAQYLHRRWPGRVVSFNWGPWESSGGMVSAALAKQFAEAGVHVIDRAAGRKAFVNELLHGSKDDVEVVYGGPLRTAIDVVAQSTTNVEALTRVVRGPLLQTGDARLTGTGDAMRVVRRLDPAVDRYLLDHQLDGKPVMPMAMGLELFAELAAALHPELEVASILDLRVLRGISLDREPVELEVEARTTPVDGGADVELTMRCAGDRGDRYHGRVEMRAKPAYAGRDRLLLAEARPLALSVGEAYDEWLFHGPMFAGIKSVEGVGAEGIIATLAASNPKEGLAGKTDGHWLIDPVVIDSGLQAIILWARTNLDMTPLPARLGRYSRCGGPMQGMLHCEARIASTPGNPNILVDIQFVDGAGHLVGRIEHLEATCSRALNRLAAGKAVAGRS
ncbi:MAG: acyltransferase domain-containing protein [Phycisphaerae bacterium]|nr:acyltransferase domain-containing protein [Phycisphaerae bacterium]